MPGFRYGGDELAVLLPWSNKEKALELAERIRQRIERIDIEGLKVTVTCAVARYEQTASNLLKQGKGGGKNQVIVE